jgi:cell wall-associated NlpC family hydrolase
MAVWMAAILAAGVVVEPVANLHSRPSAESDVVSQAIYGTNVSWLDTAAGWVRIKTPDDYTGWIAAAALRRAEAPYAASGRVAEVAALFANLYREPDVTKHQPLLTVPFETRLAVTAEPERDGSRWVEVRLPDGRAAWIQRGDVTFESRKLSIDETIALGKRFVGLPYLWGGTSTFGYDCSGFTQMLYRRRGVLIPRDSGPQARWDGVAPVEKSRLQPGDLLFFGPAPDRITHTGMYIGNREFLHATTHERPMVQVSRLDENHWTRLFVGARRLKRAVE